MIGASRELGESLHAAAVQTFGFQKRGRGIAFSIPFRQWDSLDAARYEASPTEHTHYCVMTIVDKGKSAACIQAARSAGAKGGTVIHGRGAGVPVDFYFPLTIEPQKDVVIIITTKDKTHPIKEKISAELQLAKPGNGILFVLPVSKTSGLLADRGKERTGIMP